MNALYKMFEDLGLVDETAKTPEERVEDLLGRLARAEEEVTLLRAMLLGAGVTSINEKLEEAKS